MRLNVLRVLPVTVLLVCAFHGASAQQAVLRPTITTGPKGRVAVHLQVIPGQLREHFKAPVDRGLLVMKVEPRRPSVVTALQPGDILVAVEGRPLRRPADLARPVSQALPRGTLQLRIIRDGKARVIIVKPEALTSASDQPIFLCPREERKLLGQTPSVRHNAEQPDRQ